MSDEVKIEPSESKNSSKSSLGALVAALLTAIVTGAVGYGYSIVSDARKSKVDFVNEQIQKLYGPLYAASQADDKVWDLFVKQRWKDASSPEESDQFFNDKKPPSVEQVRRWRRWMRSVFQPLNVQMETLITSNTHLLVGEGMPRAFSSLISHAESYKSIIASWGGDEDLKECSAQTVPGQEIRLCPALSTFRNTSGINYPDAIVDCIEEDYASVRHVRDAVESHPLQVFKEQKIEQSTWCNKQFRADGAADVSVHLHP